MAHIVFNDTGKNKYKIALLIKESALKAGPMRRAYVDPLVDAGISDEEVFALSLKYDSNGKAPASLIKKSRDNYLKGLDTLGITCLYIADSAYFKSFAGVKKAPENLGYVLPCAVPGYEHINCIYGINHKVLLYDPSQQEKVDLSINTAIDHLNGSFTEIGADVIHSESYPKSLNDISDTLAGLHQYPALAVDIEAFSLKFYEAGIGTIEFANDEHNGTAFCVEYESKLIPQDGVFGVRNNGDKAQKIKKQLRKFFEDYEGKLIYHNANYDVKVLIYELFMDDLGDTEGMLHGLEVMTRNIEDTKLIAYLATNSCAGNELSLKNTAHEFLGNYAQDDIKDIRRIEKTNLLRYNLRDGLGTWYTYNKYYPIMVADEQEQVYREIFLPSVKMLLQIELTGMPLDIQEVYRVKKKLTDIRDTHVISIMANPIVNEFIEIQNTLDFFNTNMAWKKKREPISYFKFANFNPNSGKQLQFILYEMLGFEVFDTTDSGAPSTAGDTLKKLQAYASNDDQKNFLKDLIGLGEVEIIVNTFINSFLTNSAVKPDGWTYLFGNFNLGGTKSGRLSSSKPNLQNIPSGSKYAKLIKGCFVAPPAHYKVDREAWGDIIAPIKSNLKGLNNE